MQGYSSRKVGDEQILLQLCGLGLRSGSDQLSGACASILLCMCQIPCTCTKSLYMYKVKTLNMSVVVSVVFWTMTMYVLCYVIVQLLYRLSMRSIMILHLKHMLNLKE